MASPIVNRYKQMLSLIPRGDFYSVDGHILPYRSMPYQLRITTGIASQSYSIYLNGIFNGLTTTNASGVALISVKLVKGTSEIKLVDNTTLATFTTYVTTRHYATWLASQAEVIETIDSNTEQILLDSYLASSSADAIDAVFGAKVEVVNDMGYEIASYRELLQELISSYRNHGGTVKGVSDVVRAIARTSPVITNLNPWKLGADLLYPGVDVSRCTEWSTSPLTNTNAGGASVSIVGFSGNIGKLSTSTLSAAGAGPARFLGWMTDGIYYGPLVRITADGQYKVYATPQFNKLVGSSAWAGTAFTIDGSNDQLSLSIDGKTTLHLTLTHGSRTAAQIATEINTATIAHPAYGAGLYSTIANSQDLLGSGHPSLAINSGVYYLDDPTWGVGSVEVYLQEFGAIQTLFDGPFIRAGLNGAHLAGVTTLNFNGAPFSGYNERWPEPTVDNPLSVVLGGAKFMGASQNGDATSANAAELVSVTHIDKVAGTMTLAAPTINPHQTLELLRLAGEDRLRRQEEPNDRYVVVNVTNYSAIPTGPVYDTVAIQSTGLPDGFVFKHTGGGVAPPSGRTVPAIRPFEQDRDISFYLPSDGSLDYCEISFPVRTNLSTIAARQIFVDFWVMRPDPSATPTNSAMFSCKAIFDGTTPVAPVSMTWVPQYIATATQVGTWAPVKYTAMWVVPENPISFNVVLASVTAVSYSPQFCKIRVYQVAPPVLGSSTMVLSESQAKTGANITILPSTAMSTSEINLLTGTTDITKHSQDVNGAIDRILPTNVYAVKNVLTPGVGNTVLGMVDESEALAGTITNMNLVIGTPAKFSWLEPALASIQAQTITWTGGTAPYNASLGAGVTTTQNMAKSVIYEDGIPWVQDGSWYYTSANTLQTSNVPSPTSVYTFEYEALIQFTTGVVDTGATARNWTFDYHAFLRPDLKIIENVTTIGLQPDASGIAVITDKANTSQGTATLIQDLGLNNTYIIPTSQWSFLTGNSVAIDQSAFDPTATYQLTYQYEWPDTTPSVVIKTEIQDAVTSVMPGTWRTVHQGQPIVINRYVQMRITLTNVKDTKDCKISTLCVKGINI